MSVIIQLNESNASRRVVPLPPLVQSNGTSACTNESGRTFGFMIGGIDYGSGGSISAVSTVMGLYVALFSASKVSAMGQGMIYYGGTSSSSTALPAATPIEIVATNSYDSMRYGLFALPNADPTAAGGLIVFGTGAQQLHVSNGSVGLKAQTHSQVTITGINNILAGNYSGVSFESSNLKPGNYSGVSLEILTGGIQTTSIGKGSYSGVSVEIKTGGIQTASIGIGNYSGVSFEVKSGGIQVASVGAGAYSGVSVEITTKGIGTNSIASGTYSGFTVGGIGNYANISNVTLAAGIHSGATVAINDIKPNAYSGVTIDGAKFLSVAGERSQASSLLSTNMGSSRLYQEYLWSMRNKISISGSTATVFLPDDVTSAYTMSVTTAVSSVQGVDGGGRA